MINEYFFSKLNDIGKKCYRKVIDAINKNEISVNLGMFTKEDVIDNILLALNYDHPELFHVDFKQIRYVRMPMGLIYYINYSIKPSLREIFIKNINDKIDYILKNISDLDLKTDYEKCRWIHNYFVKNIRYNFEALHNSESYPDSFRIDGVFGNQLAVCEGISKAYKLLCDKLEIESLIAFGTASLQQFGKEMSHAWNMVKINGQFTNIDVTWDIGVSEPCKYIRYDYFCIPDKYIKLDHTYSDFPLCETDEWSFFRKRKRIFNGVRGLKNYLEIELNKNSDILYFKIIGDKEFPSDIQNKINNLVNKMVLEKLCCIYVMEMIPNYKQMCFFYRIKRGERE